LLCRYYDSNYKNIESEVWEFIEKWSKTKIIESNNNDLEKYKRF